MRTIIAVIRAEKAHKLLTKPTREAVARSPSLPSQRDSRLSLLWIGLLGA